MLDNVIWIPSQALFESDGRTFVYLQTPPASCRTTSNSSAAAKARPCSPGIKEGESVAMSNPDQQPTTRPIPTERRHEGPQPNDPLFGLRPGLSPISAPRKPARSLTALGIVFGVGSRHRHARHRRRRPRGIAPLHRTTRRPQRPHRFPPRHQPGGVAAAPPLLARPLRPRRPHPQSQHRRSRDPLRPPLPASRARASQTLARNSGALRRATRPTASSTACTSPKAGSSTSPTTPPAPPSASSAKAPRSICSATIPPSANSSR